MTPLAARLSAYGDYHRDPRNVATHLVGIPLIVVAVGVLASRPLLPLGDGLTLTPAMLIALAASLYYLWLDRGFGIVMATLMALNVWLGLQAARLDTPVWFGLGLGLFVVGWAFQFLGHHYEGRKPAFLDDLSGLIIGPLFVAAEVSVRLGLRRELKAALGGPPPRDSRVTT
ncbi:DUF962 domain-containing protein [Novosphingobium piscinae]|uniref:DUF962 domain-containing protein n=1 Tax=Novosphingobium piscinae TaxID=1507448 RepID=A0A7X1FYS1_9SPHN|nr:Mpo1-like protein [Novosphingobium piscinae]MBC2669354.1 DUF962 domain-containing protein [Novosphingobium piscinae]